MADNLPENVTAGIADAAKKLNLLEVIGGQGLAAISRLVGAATDIPASKLNSKVKEINTQAEAKAVVDMAIANAVAAKVAADPEVLNRAAEHLLRKEYRYQQNREAVAHETLLSLEDQSTSNSASQSSASEALDEDWMNVFEQYAENASSERMQKLWGRVLAGEIRKPKSYSLKTIRFISELDQATAEIVERHFAYVVESSSIPKPRGDLSGILLAELNHLQDMGLINGVLGSLASERKVSMLPAIIRFHEKVFVLFSLVEHQHSFEVMTLTQAGREIYKLLDIKASNSIATEVALLIRTPQLKRIALAPSVNDALNPSMHHICWEGT